MEKQDFLRICRYSGSSQGFFRGLFFIVKRYG